MKIILSFLSLVVASTMGFTPCPISLHSPTLLQAEGRLETIEFKIYPDGRVEQIVQGVKGEACLKITEEINEALGEVVHTQPTEEMYQSEVVISEEIKVTNSENNGYEGSSSW
mmetsp:Transcript_5251/g.7584  ORF Transcript_5251/g.7584 Transcript_5251/m.7584 type:complete len:113 (+) Transcript_5251:87-425(+)